MDPGSIGLSYVQSNFQKLKICQFKQLRRLFLKRKFLHISATIFDKFEK